jgi:hypothetical protein
MSKRSGGEAVSEAERAAEPETANPVVRIGPALARGVTTVTQVDISVAAGIGELADDQRVLIPFLECAINSSRSEDKPLWVGRLTMDNVAFLIEQVAVGLLEALDPLASMSHGDLKPQPGRINYAADRAASASESLREAAVKLRTIASQHL